MPPAATAYFSYNSGSVNPGVLGKFYIYCRDPRFAGGTVTFFATSNVADLTSFNDVVCFGVITTTGGGSATGVGGGGGNSGVKQLQ